MQLTPTNLTYTLTPEAESAFLKLKDQFTTALVPAHLDPSLQFMVEVGASNTQVGAILFQCSTMDQKL